MTTVILVDAAEERLDEIVEWWRTHRHVFGASSANHLRRW